MRLVGLVGFKGSGKDTASLPLIENGFIPISFADALKDVLATVFCWPRDLLEGTTPESRVWREQVDEWWSKRLGILNFTPRFAMQNIGTDVLRRHFNQSLWVMNVERRLLQMPEHSDVVVRDCRFPDEIKLLRAKNARILQIQRGPEPVWAELAREALRGVNWARHEVENVHGIHFSEYAWMATPVDAVISNDGSINDLREAISMVLRGLNTER